MNSSGAMAGSIDPRPTDTGPATYTLYRQTCMVYMVCNSHPFPGDAPCASARRAPRSVPVTERVSEPRVLLTRSSGPKRPAPAPAGHLSPTGAFASMSSDTYRRGTYVLTHTYGRRDGNRVPVSVASPRGSSDARDCRASVAAPRGSSEARDCGGLRST